MKTFSDFMLNIYFWRQQTQYSLKWTNKLGFIMILCKTMIFGGNKAPLRCTYIENPARPTSVEWVLKLPISQILNLEE